MAGAAAAPGRFSARLTPPVTLEECDGLGVAGAPVAAFDSHFQAQVGGFLRAAKATAGHGPAIVNAIRITKR